jgi:hypothetical protein
MTANIPLVVKKLYKKVKDIDVYELMLLSIRDHADWLVTEYRRICREEAKAKSRGEADYYTLFTQCLYESTEEVKKMLYTYIHDVYESVVRLFGVFYNYELPENPEFNRKVEEIVWETLRALTPNEPKV